MLGKIRGVASLFLSMLMVMVPSSAAAPVASGTSCATPGATALPGCWTERLPLGSAGFPASPGSRDRPLWQRGKFPLTLSPVVGFNGELWMTAQTLSYSSPDGLTWAQHAKTDWGERIYHATVYFKGKLWMYGGMDYQARSFLNDIWSSPDGKAWAKAGTAAWPARGAHRMLVFQNKLWLFGGANHAARDRSPDAFLNDIWVSEDGLAWTEVTHTAPWSPRGYPGVLVFNGELVLVGGQDMADVWRSANGTDWAQLAAQAPWKARAGGARLVFDDKLWVFGGTAGRSTNALNDVWYSGDGLTWQRQAEHAPWGPRAPIAIVFQDKIWIYSGKHTGGDDSWGGDLWQMSAATKIAR